MDPSRAGEPKPSPSSTTRRRFLTSAAAGTGSLLMSGALPHPAMAASFLDDTFHGLAAFTVPGNDRYSKQQRLSTRRPGGVDALAGKVVQETLDSAIPIVIGKGDLAAPGALGLALMLESLAIHVNPLSVLGPFSSPFANLTFRQKRSVLQKVDNTPLLNSASIEYAANVLITVAAFGAYSEYEYFDPKTKSVRQQPRGWSWSNYGGVSDGWPEFIGYYEGRTEVTG